MSRGRGSSKLVSATNLKSPVKATNPLPHIWQSMTELVSASYENVDMVNADIFEHNCFAIVLFLSYLPKRYLCMFSMHVVQAYFTIFQDDNQSLCICPTHGYYTFFIPLEWHSISENVNYNEYDPTLSSQIQCSCYDRISYLQLFHQFSRRGVEIDSRFERLFRLKYLNFLFIAYHC